MTLSVNIIFMTRKYKYFEKINKNNIIHSFLQRIFFDVLWIFFFLKSDNGYGSCYNGVKTVVRVGVIVGVRVGASVKVMVAT